MTTSPTAARTTRAARRVPFGLVVLATGLPMFMATLDNLVMTNALPAIRLDLGASIEELQWFMNAYTLAFASFILMAAALGDRFGRRTVFAVGIALFTLSSAAAALATDPTQLIVARAFQGLGGAAIMPLSLSLLAGAVSPQRRPLAIGIWGGTAGLAVALGPLVGGAVVEGWNWNAIFWLNVPIGIVAIPIVLALLPNPFGERMRADVLGVVLAGLGVLGLVWGIVRGNDAGWDSAEVLTGLIGGGLLLVAFVQRQQRGGGAQLPQHERDEQQA
ncbi:MAG: MFS transporter, partial [Protaetiibacter sp.]